MRKKLLILMIMFFILSIIFSSCGRDPQNTEKIIYYLKNLSSYSCNVNILIKNDKQQINYNGKQFYDSRYGERFDLENNKIIIYKESKIYVKDIKRGNSYNIDKNFDSLFKFSFIEEYISLLYTNEKIENSFKKVENEEYQVINLDIPGNNKNMYKAQLYVNIKDNVPAYAMIYDSKYKKRIEIKYTDFKANVELKEDMFKIN